MTTPLIRPRTVAIAAAFFTAACSVSPAFAAISLPPTEQWSSYLLYGSIALLVAGVLAKMLTYRNGGHAEVIQPMQNDGDVTIGTYRNKVLAPGN
jgi:hypothetical protein